MDDKSSTYLCCATRFEQRRLLVLFRYVRWFTRRCPLAVGHLCFSVPLRSFCSICMMTFLFIFPVSSNTKGLLRHPAATLNHIITMAAMIKPEVVVGGALVGACLFANYVYKMPSGVLAREKTGYVPVEIKRADADAKKPALYIKRRPSSSTDPSNFCYTPPDSQQVEK